jgi:hypothetical protein
MDTYACTHREQSMLNLRSKKFRKYTLMERKMIYVSSLLVKIFLVSMSCNKSILTFKLSNFTYSIILPHRCTSISNYVYNM